MTRPKIGLLPLYLELYDNALPDARPRIDAFYSTIASELEKRGLEVVRTDVCRLAPEFNSAIKSFESVNADAVVTLHLAYSPSLESASALAGTKLPIIVLDTTPTFNYGPMQESAELMYNHGIHGVQDMCNLLIRNGKPFQIEVGHWEKSDVLDRVAAWARAARMASAMRMARIGLIGQPFEGMGDFAVPDEVLSSAIGVRTVPSDPAAFRSLLPDEADYEVLAELASDTSTFSMTDIDPKVHLDTARTCIAVRGWMEKEKLTGFSVNFGSVDSATGLPTVPFLEASKAMARGQGYAGEGDVLTAALVGALASVYPETTFTEMFCPDWENGTIFVNHMGEMNINLVDGKPVLLAKEMPWIKVGTPAFAVGRFRGGVGVFINLAPGPDNTFTLITVPVTMLAIKGEDNHTDLVRGWFRPNMPVADFLEAFSCAGGTHHSALVYGDVSGEITRFGRLMGWNLVMLGADKR